MDPEIQRDYEEHMRTMVDLLNQQATATSKLLNSLQSTSKAADAVKSNTEATKKQTEVLSGSTKALEAGAVAQQKYAEAAANFSRGLISGQAAVTNFGKALIDGQKNLEKYGNAFDNAGDAAWDIGKNFGVLGMVVGGAAKALGFFAAGIFKSVDSVVQFRDETSKFAGILPTTLSGIQELGSNARFSGEEIMKLSKTMSGFGTNILSLGGSAGEGALRFMEMAAVTDDVRRKFGRLGVDQDRLLEMQGMYIQMQGISGKALENRTKTEGQLQRESLAYAKNLIIMSDLTGQTAEQMQQEREIVKAEFEEQVKIRQENIQIQRLRAAGEHEAADAIKKEQDNRTQLIQTMTDTYGRDIGSQFGRLARTGVYDQFTSGLATLGVSATEVSNIVKTSGNIQADSLKQAQKVTDLQNNMVERVGDSFQFMGEESARALLGSTEAITKGNNYLGKNLEEEVEKSKKAAAAKEAEGDAMADAVEQIRSSEREIQKLYYDSMYALAEIVVPKFAGALEWATQKLFEIINGVQANFDWFVGEVKKWAPILAVITGAFIGMKVATTVVSLFNGLAKGTKGLTSVFSGLRNALSGAINWIRGLVGGGGGGGGAPKKGADGRYRDAQGRFAKAPKGGGGSRILNVAKGAGRILGKLALPLAGAFAAYDAYQGFNADPNASFGGKMANAGKSALSGLTFGLSEYITGGVTTGTPEQKAATEKQVTAATTNKTASEGMATASADFKNTVAELAKTNKESYEKIVSASTGGQTTEEIEKRKEATTANNDALASNTKNFENSTNQTIRDIEQRKILSKNSQDQMKQQTVLFKVFADAVDASTLMLKTFKDSMQTLVNQIGTSLLQIIAPTGGGADTPATIDSFLAMTEKLESKGGTILTPIGMSNTGSIGGRYHMSDDARRSAFNEMTDDEKRQLASLGFTSAPTLRQLVRGTGRTSSFVSANAEQADRLLGRAGARRMIRVGTQDYGRTPTHAEGRGMWWHGEAGMRAFQRALQTNPNMKMADLLSSDDNDQYHGRTVAEQMTYIRDTVNGAMGATGTGLYANADLNTPDARRIIAIAAALQQRGYRVSGHPHYEQTVGHADKSRHYLGLALDINKGNYGMAEMEQHKDEFDALQAELKGQGFGVMWGDAEHRDHLHLQLAKGGIVSGPSSGYPATLHGTEVVTPLNMDSILMRLAKTPAAANEADGMLGSTVTREALDRMSFAHKEMIDVLTRKLDNMIDALDDGNSTRTRILRNSMV